MTDSNLNLYLPCFIFHDIYELMFIQVPEGPEMPPYKITDPRPEGQ